MRLNLLVLLLFLLSFLKGTAQQCSCSGRPYFNDADGDGYGVDSFDVQVVEDLKLRWSTHNCKTAIQGDVAFGCDAPSGFVDNHSDCDDNDARVFPGMTWYEDNDNDNVGGSRQSSCGYPSGHYVLNGGDCDDNNPAVQSERTFFTDADGDGFPGTPVQACSQGSYVTTSSDCNDGDPNIKGPTTWYLDGDGDGKGGASETTACSKPGDKYVTTGGDECDEVNGVFRKNIWYEDGDNDGYGNPNSTQYTCTKPSGNWVGNGDDLDDSNSRITDVREQNYYEDNDGDGYGNPDVSVYTSNPPQNYVTDNSDCNDNDSSQYPGAVWYQDNDGDGYGNRQTQTTSCLRPSGYVSNHSDIDDNNRLITNVTPRTFYEDKDGDTYGNPNKSAYQSFPPTGNWVTNNNDCNDNDASLHNLTLWALDQDGDGFGYNANFLTQTNNDRKSPNTNGPPAGVTPILYGCINPSTASYTYVKNNSTDYDDTLLSISDVKPQWFYPDNDKDNFGTNNNALFQSKRPNGYAPDDGDCDDNNPLLHPQTVWYEDADGDSFGNVSSTLIQCQQPPSGYVSNSLDYSDTTTHVTNIKPEYFYRDADGDLYGNPNVFLFYSYKPEGYVRNNTDCKDDDKNVNPETLWYYDGDGDGYGTTSSTIKQCTKPANYVTNKDDYDDSTVHIINIAPQYFYYDGDGDSYGDPKTFVYYSLIPKNYVTNKLDCDDTDKTVNPQKVWFRDADGDGLGTHTVTTTSCLKPEGYVENFEDLGDETKYITNITPIPFYYDADRDGYADPNNSARFSYAPPNYYSTGTDCNDNNPRIHPNTIWYYDKDGDGFGDEAISFLGCVPPEKYVLERGDLDVNNPLITNIPGQFYYRDKDNDGYGVSSDQKFQSYPPQEGGYALRPGDCDDNDATIHPAMAWYADNDNDSHGGAHVYTGCNPPPGLVREGGDFDDYSDTITNIAPRYFYEDADGDGDGNPAKGIFSSYAPYDHYVPNKLDCDDTDSTLHHRTYWFLDADNDTYGDPEKWKQQCIKPGENYVLNGWDYDDSTNRITNIKPRFFYPDADGDGYGPDPLGVLASHPPNGFVSDGGDCDDTNVLIHPETHWYLDTDQDGYGGETVLVQCELPGGFYVLNSDDWDDNEACITDVFPRDFYADNDEDGYGDPDTLWRCSLLPEEGYVINGDDCDDTDPGIKPTTLWYQDKDGDGYGTEEETLIQCEPPEGYANRKGDCDDNNPYVVPSAVRVILAQGLDPNTQTKFRDCLAPEPEEEIEEDDKERQFYADRDFDGFGDPEEIILPEEIGETLNFAVVLNGDDACPKVFGKFKGCPKPFVVQTELDVLQNQELRLFVKDSIPDKKEEAKKVDETILATVRVAPNPTTGLITALWEENITDLVSHIRVLGYQYNVDFEVSFSATDFTATIDLSPYPPDIYFVQFYLADGRGITKKIIKANP